MTVKNDEPVYYDPLVADALIQRYRIKGASRADIAGAVHILLARQWSVGDIVARLGISDRSVKRYREMTVVPETEVAETYSDLICNCESHEYDSKRSLYNRSRKECTA